MPGPFQSGGDNHDYDKEAETTVLGFGAGLTEPQPTTTPPPPPAEAPLDNDARQDAEASASHEQADNASKLRGCGVPPKVAMVLAAILSLLIAGFVAIKVNSNDDCSGAPARRDGLVLAACQKPADTAASSTDEASASSADTASSSSSSAGGTAGGGTAAIAPPASVPAGQILFQGQTGDNIGPIAQDGKNRFVSLTGPGVTTDGNSVTTTWDKGAGKVVSFGSNLHTSTNKGRYGFALFRNVPATPPTTSPSGEADSQYRAGCAIEVGQTSCKSDTKGQPIVNGDRVTIIIGEAGTGVGDYSADWWFVFQPD